MISVAADDGVELGDILRDAVGNHAAEAGGGTVSETHEARVRMGLACCR